MTKFALINLLKAVIDGRKSYSIICSGEGNIRIYCYTDSFTAVFITDVVKKAGDSFTGITVDCDGCPYMLFNY